jgi:hypothetical protein
MGYLLTRSRCVKRSKQNTAPWQSTRTGRPLVRRLGYDEAVVAALPDSAVEVLRVSVTRSRLAA